MPTRTGFACLLLASAAATPFAARTARAELTRTLVVIEPAPDGQGHRAIAADGARLVSVVIRGPVAGIAAEQGVVTLGLTPAAGEAGVFDATWIRAVAARELRLPSGQLLDIGTELQVLARREDELPVEYQPGEAPVVRWEVRLPDAAGGARHWLDPIDGGGLELRADERAGLSDGWIEGVVERDGERVSILALDGRRIAVEGGLCRLLGRNLGRFVQAYAVLHTRGDGVVARLLELSAATRDDEAGEAEGLQVVEGGPPGQVRIARTYDLVGEDELVIGQEWIEAAGIVLEKRGDGQPGAARYAIRCPSMDLAVDTGEDAGAIREEVLAGAIGRRVTVRGHVATEGPSRGRLVLRSVEATLGIELPATRDDPAVPAGTRVRVVELNDPLTCRVALEDGRVRALSRANPDFLRVGDPAIR